MNFIKMLSGDTEIIKHIDNPEDYVFSDITLESEGFNEKPECVRFRHVYEGGKKGSGVFVKAPAEGDFHIALQVHDTFGAYDEEFIPTKDELCLPFEEKLVELSVNGKRIGMFRFGFDDKKYYTFYTEEPVSLKENDEISFKLLFGEHAIFTAIVLTPNAPVPEVNTIENITSDDGKLRFTTRIASRVRIIAGDASFEENTYLNNHEFNVPSSLWGVRMYIEAVTEEGDILRGRVTCRKKEKALNTDKELNIKLNGKKRSGEIEPVLSVLPLKKGEIYSDKDITLTDDKGNTYVTETKVTSRWQDESLRTVSVCAMLPLDGRDFYAVNTAKKPAYSDFSAKQTADGILVKTGDKEYHFTNSSDYILPDRCLQAVLYDNDMSPFYAKGGKFTVSHEGANRITVSRINHFTNGVKNHLKCKSEVTFYRGYEGYSLRFGFENDLMENEFCTISGIYLEEANKCSEIIDIYQTDENTVYENGIATTKRYEGNFSLNGDNIRFVDFWQNYPKSFNAGSEGLRIGICPFIKTPDFYCDENFDIQARLFFYLKTGKYEFHCGLEKTHTIVFGKDADMLCNFAFLQPDPVALEESCAFGHIKHDCPDFKEYDDGMDKAMELFKAHRESYREYGMLNYGDSFGEREVHWTNEEYDFTCGMLIHFLRTGDERFYEMAKSGAQHYVEVDYSHRNIHFEEDGYFFVHTVGHANNYYPHELLPTSFKEIKSHIGHIFVQGMAEYYKATGDERFKDAVVRCGHSIAKYYTIKYDFLTEREPGWGMLALEAAYELTNDEFYLNACRIIVKRVYEKQDKKTGCLKYFMIKPDGGVCYGGKSFMHGIVGSAIKYYYYLTGDEKAKEICLGIARWLATDMYDDEIQAFWYTEVEKQECIRHEIPETNIEILDVILFAVQEDNKKEYMYAIERAFSKTLNSPYRRECDVAKVFSMRLRFAPEIMYYYNKAMKGN